MHIIQVSPRFPPAIGGVEEHVYQISKELTKRGHQITVLTSNEIDGRKHNQDDERIEGIRVRRFSMLLPRLLRETWLLPGIAGAVRKLDGDIIHAHGYRCLSSWSAIRASKSLRKSTVLTPHGIYPPRSFANAAAKRIFDDLFGSQLLEFSDIVIALTRHNELLLRQMGVPSTKLKMVPNGVNLESYTKLRKSPLKKRNSSGPMLLYVGRLDWNKQIDRIIEAMPFILKEFPLARFVAVGPDYGNYKLELSKIAKKCMVERSVRLVGKVSSQRLLELYSAADVFILPSSYEGFGLSMLEAMASRTPVIVSPTGGPGDILSDGVNALFLKTSTPLEIYERVHMVLAEAETRNRIVENALGLVSERYTWHSVVNKLELIYDQMS